MAIYHFRTSIIKASKGKCAVASAAYQAGISLYDDRLGETFSYKTKDEVVYSEILLPENAPANLQERSVLWNEVERVQNKKNSRYARQFEFSLPIEWSEAERISYARDFIKKSFVDQGMVADWAYHDKPGNPHVHCMTTVRGFNKNGTWATMEKKAYVLDENGNRIPEIDPKTGKQKIRIRKGKYEEKIWKRETVQSNNWNKRSTLIKWRKDWADFANSHLTSENHIDHRSYKEQGIDKIPTIHEGPGMRELEKRGIVSNNREENREINKLNSFFDKAKRFIQDIRMQIESVKKLLFERRKDHDKGRSTAENGHYERMYSYANRVSEYHTGPDRTVVFFGSGDTGSEEEADIIRRSSERVSRLREQSQHLIERNRTLAESVGDPAERERNLKEVLTRVEDIRKRRQEADERSEKIRRTLMGTVGGTSDHPDTGRTAGRTVKEDKGISRQASGVIRGKDESRTGKEENKKKESRKHKIRH